MNTIEVEGLSRTFNGRSVIDGLAFSVQEGEIFGFLGPNGAGKTTTLKMLSGLLHPTGGKASVLGFTPWELDPDYLRTMTLVMGQRNRLSWDIPAADSFLLAQAIYRLPDDQYKATYKELDELLELEPLMKKPVRNLSLGERMKCEIAAGLLHRPKVLFLDEPTIGLDITGQVRIREFLREYNKRTGATILLTSHYMADVTALCERIIIIHQGQLKYDGGINDLSRRIAPFKLIGVLLASYMGTQAQALGLGGALHPIHIFDQLDAFLRSLPEVLEAGITLEVDAQEGGTYWNSGKGDAGIAMALPDRVRRLCHGVAGPWLLFTVVVYVFAFLGGFAQTWGRDYTPTLAHFRTAFDLQWGQHGLVWAGTAWNSLFTTVKLAAIAAPICAALGLLISWLLARTRFVGQRTFEFGALLAFAIPGTVLGVSYILAFNVPPFELTGTGLIIVLCFVFRNLPVGVRAGTAAFKQIDKSLDEASTLLRASTATTLRRVILPFSVNVFALAAVNAAIDDANSRSAAIRPLAPVRLFSHAHALNRNYVLSDLEYLDVQGDVLRRAGGAR